MWPALSIYAYKVRVKKPRNLGRGNSVVPPIPMSLVSSAPSPTNPTRVIVLGAGLPAKLVTVDYRRIDTPLISLLLSEYCQLGELVDTGSEYGRQVSARVQILYRGASRLLLGAIVPLVGACDLILPGAFLT